MLFADRKLNNHSPKSDSTCDSLPRTQDGPSDYLSQKMNTFTDFNMSSQYANEPIEKIRILQEIYDTEKTYVKALTLVDEIFVNELALRCPKTQKLSRSMFGEISAIGKTHEILLESLRSKPIAEVFTKFIPFLKLYTSYASHYANGLKIYAKLMSNSDFRKTLTKIEEDPRVEGKKLQAYLIMPIQRIPRYIMLIQSLMNYTTNQEDMADLYKALTGMQALTDQIQSCMAAYENGERLLDIQLSFGLDAHILEPGRVLLKEGVLYKREIHGSPHYREIVVFLFNDILLYGSKKISLTPQCKYDPSAILALRHCLVELDDEGGNMEIRCGNVGIDLTAYPLAGVNEWYDTICDAIDNVKKLRDTLRKESFNHKTMVFDKGFWKKNRDRLRNIIRADPAKPSLVSRVLRKKQIPKIEDFNHFANGSMVSRKRAADMSFQGQPLNLYEMSEKFLRDAQIRQFLEFERNYEYAQGERYFDDYLLNSVALTQPKPGEHYIVEMATQGVSSMWDCESDSVFTDDDDYVPPEKKIPIRRAASYDEEDRRPRSRGGFRRTCASEPRRQLAVDDIRKLSYQNRTLEPFNMFSDDDEEEIDEIELKVKGERSRRWWEEESAPPVIKNQKSSFMDSVRNNCSIM
ncbi:hypothetical protein CAEBREN_20241 [Caenorhabditis brenneri]|uniref:DH domain-containing protein n=1 Tax=Caenorhabditis brenneri TaxID=135651 RepID=G0M7S3_CAEBE|nr:hypothetical protein CAEBREN_20241 [Caenorhabditis brenneri]